MDISESDIEKVILLLKKKATGELTDEELNDVAGGFVSGLIVTIVCSGFLVGGIIASYAC